MRLEELDRSLAVEVGGAYVVAVHQRHVAWNGTGPPESACANLRESPDGTSARGDRTGGGDRAGAARARDAAGPAGGPLGPAAVLALQRTAGNAAVTALLAREPAAIAEKTPIAAAPRDAQERATRRRRSRRWRRCRRTTPRSRSA